MKKMISSSWILFSMKRMMNKRLTGTVKAILFLVIILCGLNMVSRAGDDGIEKPPVVVRLSGTTTVAGYSQPLVVNGIAENIYIATGQHKVKNIITLSVIEETQKYISASFSVTVQVKIEYGHSSSYGNQYTQNLTVDYNNTEGAKYNARNYFNFEGAEYVKVTVMGITPNPAMVGSLNIMDVLLLENEMRVTEYAELGNNITYSTFSGPTSVVNPVDAVPVTWSWPANSGYNTTQLEWTWLETELASNYYIPNTTTVDENKLFQNNSTRVDLPYGQGSYNIPLFYDGLGKLYYRIRAVNQKASGSRSDGPWSAARTCSYGGHDNNLNWQVRTSFAEEGKMKSVMEYFDGTQRSRQMVTKENVTNTTIVSETFYDGQGRPAIQILPTPGINTIISYTKNLNLFNGQSSNEDPAKYFDLEPIAAPGSQTPVMVTTSGSSQYYSPSNPEINTGGNKNIPDAEGYPYSVTRYTPDATGRIMIQSGVGIAMKMGSGRETKYYYGTPSQEQLDGLFGTEVGIYTHYLKNMIKDPNGQMSISYVDMHGRTIATALAGSAPANLSGLNTNNASQYPNQAGTYITQNLLDNNSNVVKNNSIESINSLLVPATTVYSFRYQLNPDTVGLLSCASATLCYDCMYNLEISITDESGDAPPIVKKYNNVSLTPDDNCTTPIQQFKDEATGIFSNIIQFSQTLQPGSYSVRKTLTISESSLQKYKDMYLTQGLCKTQQQLIDSVYNAMLSVSGCGSTPPATCQDCLNSLGTYTTFRTNYLTSVGNPNPVPPALEAEMQTAYNAGVQNCNSICNTSSQVLITKRQLMLADMIPYGGQYATDVPISTANGTQMYDKYNIFSTSYNPSAQPYFKKPWNSSKILDYYYDANNNKDLNIHPDGGYTLLNSTSKDDFSQQFTSSWANALLPHHPEYDKLVFSEANLTGSYNWLNTFNNTADYNTAYNSPNSFIYTASTTGSAPNNDPFYSIAPSAYKTAMLGWVTTNYRNNLSMWQIAYGDVKCKNITNLTARDACYTSAPVIPPYANLTAAENNQLWKVFRNLYSAERDNQVNQYIAAAVPLADTTSLINQGYILRFPTNKQIADQSGWTWYPPTAGGSPNLPPTIPQDSISQDYPSTCSSYIQQWKQTLLQCSALATNPQKDAILNAITSQMVAVCIKGSNAANPYGSSTVAPGTPNDGSPRSFEEVINTVFNSYGLPKTYYCNPFVIEFPKPFGKGPKFTKEVTSVIDTCNCSRFAQLKAEAQTAGYNPNSLSSLNIYFNIKYGDTLTQALYDGLQHCSELGPQLQCHTEIQMITAPCNTVDPCGYSKGGPLQPKRITDSLMIMKKQILPKSGGSADSSKTDPKTSRPPICPIGQHWDFDLGFCVPDVPPCPSGQHWDANLGQCVSDVPACPTGQHWDASLQQCVADGGPTVPICIDGYHWNPLTHQCEPDVPYYCDFQCSYSVCNTVYNVTYPLITLQPMPDFLKCGFISGQKCFSCAEISSLITEFKSIFTIAPYGNGPNFSSTSLSDDDLAGNSSFARFVNYRTGYQYNWIDYAKAAANASPVCNLANYASNSGATQNVICADTKPLNDTTGVFVTDPPCQKVYTMAVSLAQNIYDQRIEYLMANFENAYKKKCLAAKNIEQFTVSDTTKEYHYTLYYYDMAGNLVKTVPPAGVRPDFSTTYTNSVKAARAAGTTLTRPHLLTTNYRYNSLDKLMAQNSPDANTTNFWYDKLGRLVVSQNSQQTSDGKYSYTMYDYMGRTTEVGQKPQSTSMTQTISQDTTALKNWIISGGGIREQVTLTGYDFPYGANTTYPNGILYGTGLNQRNLRNRVSYVSTKNIITDPQYTATYFTYDIYGNVDTLLQDYSGIPEMQSTQNSYKRFVYDYDLISHKVNKVSYQEDWYNTVTNQLVVNPDKFFQKFEYDADNQLLKVYSSRDNIFWERDAAYSYYKYGPISRTELGQLRVQGMDYAYTLHGWLKGINSTSVGDGSFDIDRDGLIGGPNNVVARDVIGLTLHYYDNGSTESDYKSIGITSSFARPGSGSNFLSLFNGNISAIGINNSGLLKGAPANTNALPLFYNYGYDALNRLVSMQAYNGLNTSNQWVPVSINDYHESIGYDPNGNILSYNRKGAPIAGKPLEMDDLGYNYYPNTNRLKQVTDNVAYTSNYSEDVDNQVNSNNYGYDNTGNLKTDVAEGITNINWTIYGKISSIIKGGNTISYTYDAGCNRITETANGKTTIYVRDAKGNVMSIYEKPTAGAIQQIENQIFGSKRIGTVGPLTQARQTVTLAAGFGTAIISTFTRNEKIYELNNHLGSVLVTIGDKKIQHSSSTSVDYYTADVLTATDYYPFGMIMPGRKYSAVNGYRYGFNGKENMNNVKGEGNMEDYGTRVYDTRLGKFLSVDPMTKSYPLLTPYQFAANSPIWGLDVDGLEFMPYGSSWFHIATQIFNNTGTTIPFMVSKFKPNKEYVVVDPSNVPSVYKDNLDRPLFDAVGVGLTPYGKYEEKNYPTVRAAGYNNLPQNPDWTFAPEGGLSGMPRSLSPSMQGTSTGVFKVGDGAVTPSFQVNTPTVLSNGLAGKNAIVEGIKYFQLYKDTKIWNASSDLRDCSTAFDNAVKAVDGTIKNFTAQEAQYWNKNVVRGDVINFVLDGSLPLHSTLFGTNEEIVRDLNIMYLGIEIIKNNKGVANWPNMPFWPWNYYKTKVSSEVIDAFKTLVADEQRRNPDDKTNWLEVLKDL